MPMRKINLTKEELARELEAAARNGEIEDLGNGRYRALPPEMRKAKADELAIASLERKLAHLRAAQAAR